MASRKQILRWTRELVDWANGAMKEPTEAESLLQQQVRGWLKDGLPKTRARQVTVGRRRPRRMANELKLEQARAWLKAAVQKKLFRRLARREALSWLNSIRHPKAAFIKVSYDKRGAQKIDWVDSPDLATRHVLVFCELLRWDADCLIKQCPVCDQFFMHTSKGAPFKECSLHRKRGGKKK